jgi:hypothetical protein
MKFRRRPERTRGGGTKPTALHIATRDQPKKYYATHMQKFEDLMFNLTMQFNSSPPTFDCT